MTETKKNNAGKRVALGGFVTALAVICLYLAEVLPTAKLFFAAVSTMFLLAMVIEFGIYSAIVAYLSTAVLVLLILPKTPLTLSYVFFFGYYAIVKYCIEKINNFVLEWLIKLVVFNGFLGGFYIIFIKMFLVNIEIRYSLWITVILAEIAFVVYDYGYSMAVGYYKYRFRKMLRMNG